MQEEHHHQNRLWTSGSLFQTCRLRLKCDGTHALTRFRISAKRTSPFKSARWGRQFSRLLRSRGVRISGSNAGYTMLRGSVKGTGYPLHSPFSSSLQIPCVTVCYHISTGVWRGWNFSVRIFPLISSVEIPKYTQFLVSWFGLNLVKLRGRC